MKARLSLAVAALLVLPACLDPIVGTQCARGYSPCGSQCVPAGSCAIADAGQVGDSDGSTLLDASPDEPESYLDAEAAETGPAADAESATNGAENEAGVELQDASPPAEAGLGGDGGPGDLLVPAIDAESDDAGLDGPEGTPNDAETANSGDDGGTPAVEIDGASVVDDTGVDSGPGGTVDDTGTGGADTSPLLCVGCADASETDDSASDEAGVLLGADAGNTGDSSSDKTGVLPADDGGANDASGDGAAADAGGVGADGAPQDVVPLQCVALLTACDDQCVDLTSDPENCGGCGSMCPSGVCVNGGCLVCASIETVCGQQCTNTASDPDNCGGCNAPCASGLCSNSQCEDWGTGRVIVIGHDYLKNRTAMNRILGNAVFLWPINPVRLLTYKVAANPSAITGADGAIAQVALAQGRQVQRTDLVDGDVATQFAAADVFLIYGQEQASDATLNQLGQDWASAMTAFVNRGGTVIVLDGVYSGNAGTVQIISQAGLFDIQQKASVTNAVCTVVARGDALASGLLKNYLCEPNSVSFKTSEPPSGFTSVVESGGVSVVVHKLF